VKRQFRGAEYLIHVCNPNGVQKGVTSITVDGQAIDGKVVPALEGTHTVEVVM
jgi:cellobiose phosphorylase